MNITKTFGGFVDIEWIHIVQKTLNYPKEVKMKIRFGATVISTYIDGERYNPRPMTKPQDDYTLKEIFEMKRLAEMEAELR